MSEDPDVKETPPSQTAPLSYAPLVGDEPHMINMGEPREGVLITLLNSPGPRGAREVCMEAEKKFGSTLHSIETLWRAKLVDVSPAPKDDPPKTQAEQRGPRIDPNASVTLTPRGRNLAVQFQARREAAEL